MVEVKGLTLFWTTGPELKSNLTLKNLNNDQPLISAFSNTAESFLELFMRIEEVITKLRSFDCYTNSPCQYLRKCQGKSIENMDTDVKL